MGFEWHRRPRDDHGRFAKKYEHRHVDMHFKVELDFAYEFRMMANDAEEEMSTYLQRALWAYWEGKRAEGHAINVYLDDPEGDENGPGPGMQGGCAGAVTSD